MGKRKAVSKESHLLLFIKKNLKAIILIAVAVAIVATAIAPATIFLNTFFFIVGVLLKIYINYFISKLKNGTQNSAPNNYPYKYMIISRTSSLII